MDVFRPFVQFTVRFRKSVLVVMLLATLFFLWQTINIKMFTEFIDLFPYNHPYVEIHKAYARFFGGAYQATLMLEVKNGDVFNPVTLTKMSEIQDKVDLIDGVDHFGIYSVASSKVGVITETPEGFKTKQLMEQPPTDQAGIEELKKKVFTTSAYGLYVSRDQKALLLNANFIEGIIDFNNLFDKFMAIKKKEEDANHKIYLSGTPLLYGWIYHYLPNMALILVITSVIILLMLYAYMSQGGCGSGPSSALSSAPSGDSASPRASGTTSTPSSSSSPSSSRPVP